MNANGDLLDDVDATDEDHQENVRGLIRKSGPRCFFLKLGGHFKSDCTRNKETFAEGAIASYLNAASFNTLKVEHGLAAQTA